MGRKERGDEFQTLQSILAGHMYIMVHDDNLLNIFAGYSDLAWFGISQDCQNMFGLYVGWLLSDPQVRSLPGWTFHEFSGQAIEVWTAYFEKRRALNLVASPHKFSHRLGARIHWYSLGFAWFYFKSWRSPLIDRSNAQDRNWDELQRAYGIGWGFAAHLARFHCASLGFARG